MKKVKLKIIITSPYHTTCNPHERLFILHLIYNKIFPITTRFNRKIQLPQPECANSLVQTIVRILKCIVVHFQAFSKLLPPRGFIPLMADTKALSKSSRSDHRTKSDKLVTSLWQQFNSGLSKKLCNTFVETDLWQHCWLGSLVTSCPQQARPYVFQQACRSLFQQLVTSLLNDMW